jgi:hypothetical protein
MGRRDVSSPSSSSFCPNIFIGVCRLLGHLLQLLVPLSRLPEIDFFQAAVSFSVEPLSPAAGVDGGNYELWNKLPFRWNALPFDD